MRRLFLILLFALLTAMLGGIDCAEALAGKVVYISPKGSDKNKGSVNSPWATFERAKISLRPGDTLILKDGVYKEFLLIDLSGDDRKFITIKAENDGKAIIDGEGERPTGRFNKASYINLQGIIFRNAQFNGKDYVNDGLSFFKSHHINVSRVSAYMGSPNFSLSGCSYILLEDCSATKGGRVLYNLLDCDFITMRRCFGYWDNNQMPNAVRGPNAFLQVYGSNNCIIENCFGMKNPEKKDIVEGIAIFAHSYNESADKNKILGNIIVGMNDWAYVVNSVKHLIHGNYFKNDVGIDNAFGFFQRADDALIVENLTIKGTPDIAFGVQSDRLPKDPDFRVNGTLKYSVFVSGGKGIFFDSKSQNMGSFEYTGNILFGLKKNFSGDAGPNRENPQVRPIYDTGKYGRGAYLIRPVMAGTTAGTKKNVGAQILYRYREGSLTESRLWPWPMEERIKEEVNISPTWERYGGLWKTLDGLYGENCCGSL